MKDIPAALLAHMAEEVTTLATCWKATLQDASVLGFTSHVEDLVIDGVTYEAAAGYTPTAIDTSGDLAVDNLEVEGLLDSPAITEDDLLAGRWDHAQIEIFEINYEDTSMGVNKLRRGWLGEVRLGRTNFVAELRGLSQRLQQNIIELTSASCRATLGDARCTKDLTDYTTTGAADVVTNNRQFTTDLPSSTVRLTPLTTGAPDDDYFGLIAWTSGANADLEMEVKTYDAVTGELLLQLQMPYDIASGDTFTIVARCGKRIIEDCKTRFGNVPNFRGEPYKPAPNQIIRGPVR